MIKHKQTEESVLRAAKKNWCFCNCTCITGVDVYCT